MRAMSRLRLQQQQVERLVLTPCRPRLLLAELLQDVVAEEVAAHDGREGELRQEPAADDEDKNRYGGKVSWLQS